MQPNRLRNGMKCACASAHRAFSTPVLTGLGLSPLHAQKSSESRLFNVWIKSYGVSIERNFAQYYSGDGEFGKKKIDFFVNSVLWLLMGMKELIMFVCMRGRPLQSMKLL